MFPDNFCLDPNDDIYEECVIYFPTLFKLLRQMILYQSRDERTLFDLKNQVEKVIF